MSHPTPRMTVDIWSRGTQDCGNISEKFFQNSTVFIEKYEVYKCVMGLWLLRIWLVENSREHVCSGMMVNNWSRGKSSSSRMPQDALDKYCDYQIGSAFVSSYEER